jgi:hypothetical protein
MAYRNQEESMRIGRTSIVHGFVVLVTACGTNLSGPGSVTQAVSAWELVQSSAPGYSTVSSRSCASMNNSANDLLAVYAYVGSASVTLSVSDTLGDTWSQTPLSTFTAAGTSQQWFYALAKSSGPNTITVRQSSGSAALGLFCLEYAGNTTTDVLDLSKSANAGIATASMSTGSFTTNGSSDLVLTGFADISTGGSFSPGAGAQALADDTVFAAMAESQAGLTAGTYSGTATDTQSSNHWQAYAVAFKSGGSQGTQTLSVTKAGSGSGIVTSSPAGINCGSACSFAFATGTAVTLTAFPAAGSTFASWSGACSGAGSCMVTLNSAESVSATFNPISSSTWTLVASSSPGYSTVSSRSCASISTTANDLLAVYTYAGSASVTLSLSDTLGNTWSQTPLYTLSGAGTSQQWFYAVAKSSGTNTISVKQSSGSAALGLFCFEYSGNTTSNVLDVSKSANASTATANMSSGSFTTEGTSDLVLTGFADISTGGSFSPGPGAQALAHDTVFAAMAESQAGLAAGTYSGTAADTQSSNDWQAYAVAFKSSGGSRGTQTLSVTKGGAGSGTVTSSPAGINCGSTCSFAFASGTAVTLTASPAAGSSFAGWSGACSGTGSCTVMLNSAEGATATFNTSAGPVYPLKVSSNKRYLVDQNNVPYFIDAGSPQGLITQLSEADADSYLSTRASQGFNSLWIDLIHSANNACASTYDGIPPFLTANDISTPNEAYFQRADDMINMAGSHGFSVFLLSADAYLLPMLRSNGETKDYNYGVYIGKRYKDFPNIVWLHGNDFQTWQTSDDQLLLAIANGIKSDDSSHIHTAELSYGSTTPTGWSDTFLDPNWRPPEATLDSVYTAIPTYDWMLRAYNRGLGPVYLVEGNYEHEHNLGDGDNGTPDILRKQAYWTTTSGGVGQIYGNHYDTDFLSGWQSYMDDPGAVQTGYWSALFNSLEWTALVPDQTHALLTAGYGTYDGSGNITSNDYATAALTSDGNQAVIFTPTETTMTLNMSKFSGPVTARWFDPTNGVYAAIAGSPFPNSGSRTFGPPGNNSAGWTDWVLVLTR